MNRESWIKYMMQHTGLDFVTLSNEYDSRYKPKTVNIYNSVKGFDIEKHPDDFLNELNSSQIIVENGAIFYNHDVFEALPVKSILTLVNLRNKFKSRMKYSKSIGDLIAARNYDNSQSDTKIGMNTYYGTQLMVTSKFYNADIGASITARGRGTVSINGLTLESCLGDWRPFNVVALIDMINKSKEKMVDVDILMNCEEPTNEMVVNHILGYHNDPKTNNGKEHYGKPIIEEMVSKLTTSEKKKVYYNSNFKAFMNIPYIKELIKKVVNIQNGVYPSVKDTPLTDYKKILYIDPMSFPENITNEMNEFKRWMTQLLSGYYWYEGDLKPSGKRYTAPEKIFRDMKRKAVVITDTDSLIFTLKPSMDIIMKNINENDRSNIEQKHYDLIIGSIVIYVASSLITLVLDNYTKQTLITDRYRIKISYKQEYVFRTLQTTKAAKNYLGIISSQEGVLLPFEDIDLKGLSLKKSNFNKMLSDKARHLAVDMIAKENNPNLPRIFKEVNDVRNVLSEVFRERNNLDIFTVSKLSTGYDDTPIGESRLKAVMLYNALFDDKITLPGAFLSCKIDLEFIDEEYVNATYPGMMEKLKQVADFRTLEFTKASIRTKAEKVFHIELDTGDTFMKDEYIKGILEQIESCTTPLELKETITNLKKNANKYYENIENGQIIIDFVKSLSMKNIKLKDIDKIAIPLDSETVHPFISDHADIKEIGVYENLIAVIVSGLGITTIRNASGRQIIHNILSYY